MRLEDLSPEYLFDGPGPSRRLLVGRGGLEAAKRFDFQCGGCRICIPRKPPPESRDACVRELRRRGRSVAVIASYTGLSERQVYRIIAEA